MGSGSSKGTNTVKTNSNTRTYPLQYNPNAPKNGNLLLVYNDISINYANKLIKSLGALPEVNDYTIILHNIETREEHNLARFTKREIIYNKELYYESTKMPSSQIPTTKTTTTTETVSTHTKNQTETNPTTTVVTPTTTTTTTPTKTEIVVVQPNGNENDKNNKEKPKSDKTTKIIPGIVTIYSTVLESYDDTQNPKMLKLKRSPIAREDEPLIMLQVTDVEDVDTYHDGQISLDWLKLSAPKESSTTKNMTAKLFSTDQPKQTLCFRNERPGVDSFYNESFKYIVALDRNDWSTVGPHLNTVSTKNGVYTIYNSRSRSKYFINAFELYARYYKSITEKQYKVQTNYLLFNFDTIANGNPVFNGKSVDMTATNETVFRPGVDFNFVKGKVYPRNYAIGFRYSLPYIIKGTDTVTQIFEPADHALSTSTVYEYYHGTINLRGKIEEGFVLGAVLNLKRNPQKKFTYYINPPITDANTLEYIKNHKFLTYKHGFLTNIPDFEDGVNIFADSGSSYMTLSIGSNTLKGRDLAIDNSNLLTLREQSKLNTNPFFATFGKTVTKGYFIEQPALIVSPNMKNDQYITILCAKDVSLGSFWNFARLTTKYLTIDNQKGGKNLNNWLYIFKYNKTQLPSHPDINALQLDQDYIALYPSALLTWNQKNITITKIKDGLTVQIGNETNKKYILFNKIPADISQYPELIVINEDKLSPGRLWNQDKYSGIWTFIKQSYNISIIDGNNIQGGPINPLAFSVSMQNITNPTMTSLEIQTREKLRTINVLRNLSKELAPAYIQTFESHYKQNATSSTSAMFVGIDINDFTQELEKMLTSSKHGKFYRDETQRVVVVYYLPSVMTFDVGRREVKSEGYPNFIFNTKMATTDQVKELDDGMLYCEEFVNSVDSLTMVEALNLGTATDVYIYSKPFITYSQRGFAIIYSPLVNDKKEKSFYGGRLSLLGTIRGVPNYIKCTAIEYSYGSLWAIIRGLVDSNKLIESSELGDYLLLLKPSEIDQNFSFPSFTSLLTKVLGSLASDIKFIERSKYYVVCSTKTIAVNSTITVLNEQIDIGDSLNSTSSIVYNTKSHEWISNKVGTKSTSIGFGSDLTFKQISLTDPRINVKVSTQMTNITPVVSFIILQNVSLNELQYLSNLYRQFDELKHLVVIVMSDIDLKPNLTNVVFMDNNLIMFKDSIFSATVKKSFKTFYRFELNSRETVTYMKFGIFRDSYKAVDRTSYLPALDFIVNKDTGEEYGSGLRIDSNDRVSPEFNLYSFENVDKIKAPIFHKFVNENNKYINFLRPIPLNDIKYPSSQYRWIVAVEITADKPYDIFEVITSLQQIKLQSNNKIIGFYIYSKVVPIFPAVETSFPISTISYSTANIYRITDKIFTLPQIPQDNMPIPYYYMHPSVPFIYDPVNKKHVKPEGANTIVYVDNNYITVGDSAFIAGTTKFRVSNVFYSLVFIRTNVLHSTV